MTDTGGSLIGYDPAAADAGGDGWHLCKDEPARALASSAVNMGTFFVPVAGAVGAGAKGATAGARVAGGARVAAEMVLPGGSWLVRGAELAARGSGALTRTGQWTAAVETVRAASGGGRAGLGGVTNGVAQALTDLDKVTPPVHRLPDTMPSVSGSVRSFDAEPLPRPGLDNTAVRQGIDSWLHQDAPAEPSAVARVEGAQVGEPVPVTAGGERAGGAQGSEQAAASGHRTGGGASGPGSSSVPGRAADAVTTQPIPGLPRSLQGSAVPERPGADDLPSGTGRDLGPATSGTGRPATGGGDVSWPGGRGADSGAGSTPGCGDLPGKEGGPDHVADGLMSKSHDAQNAGGEPPTNGESERTEHNDGAADAPEHSENGEGSGCPGDSVDDHVEEVPGLLRRTDETVGSALEGIRRWGPEDRARFETFLGRSTLSDRFLDSIGVTSGSVTRREAVQQMLERMAQELQLGNVELRDLDPSVADPETTYAYVNPRPPQSGPRQVYVGRLFWEQAEAGPNNRIGTLVHELSHFSDVGGSRDFIYGIDEAREFSRVRPDLAWMNADSIQYYVEQYLDRTPIPDGNRGHSGGSNEG